MPSVVLTPATAPALTLEQVHQQCRIDAGDEDSYIENILIPAVSALFEQETNCRLVDTVQEDRLACWPRSGRVDLIWGLVRSVSEVTYLDALGQLQTLSHDLYQVDQDSFPASVNVKPGASLPLLAQHPTALRVSYVAGFGSDPGANLPRDVRLWLLLHVAHFWKNREAGVTTQTELKPLLYADGLIAAYRRMSI